MVVVYCRSRIYNFVGWMLSHWLPLVDCDIFYLLVGDASLLVVLGRIENNHSMPIKRKGGGSGKDH